MSPYPTVVTVAIHHHNAFSKEFISVSGRLYSRPYIKKVPNNITQLTAELILLLHS
jgi:hypothetical protein